MSLIPTNYSQAYKDKCCQEELILLDNDLKDGIITQEEHTKWAKQIRDYYAVQIQNC